MGTLKLDETQNPRTMDASQNRRVGTRGKSVKAIYLIEGDTLKEQCCCARIASTRPTEMTNEGRGEGGVDRLSTRKPGAGK